MHKSTLKLCRERNPKFGSLDEKLFDEFTRVKAIDKTVVTDNCLKSRAQKLASNLNLTNFKRSNKWVQGFKKWHNLSTQRVCGEAEKVDADSVSQWINSKKDTPFFLRPLGLTCPPLPPAFQMSCGALNPRS